MAFTAVDADPPALQLNKALGQGQTYAVPLHGGTLHAETVEGLEKFSLFGLAQTGTTIDHLDTDPAVCGRSGLKMNNPAAASIFEPVGDEVGQNLVQTHGIRRDDLAGRRGLDLDTHALRFRVQDRRTANVFKQGRNVHGFQVNGNRAGLGARDVLRRRGLLPRGGTL